jgi:hypothetical protein
MRIIEDRLSFLDGFLQGISEVDGKIREFKILAWMMNFDKNKSSYDNFLEFFDSELTISSFHESKISFRDIELELMANILTNPCDKGFVDLDRKKYISFRIMDYIQDAIEGFTYGAIEALDIKIGFNEGGLNRYFVFPVGDKAMFILFRHPNHFA